MHVKRLCLIILFMASTTALGKLWDPGDIATLAWYDASDASTISTNDAVGKVSQWDDKSGNTNHVTQGPGEYQPRTGNRTLNGLNVLDFDGKDSMSKTGLSYSVTNIIVLAVTEHDAIGYRNLYQLAGPDTLNTTPEGESSWNTTFNAGGNVAYVKSLGDFYRDAPIMVGSFWDSSQRVHCLINGTQYANVLRTGTLDFSNIQLSSDNRFNGAFAELVIVDSGDADLRKIIEGYLAWKWGLQDNLPVEHPYKSAAPTIPDAGTVLIFR